MGIRNSTNIRLVSRVTKPLSGKEEVTPKMGLVIPSFKVAPEDWMYPQKFELSKKIGQKLLQNLKKISTNYHEGDELLIKSDAVESEFVWTVEPMDKYGWYRVAISLPDEPALISGKTLTFAINENGGPGETYSNLRRDDRRLNDFGAELRRCLQWITWQ